MHRCLLVALACLLSPGLASALPTPLTLASASGASGGFAFGFLRDATSSCIPIGGTELIAVTGTTASTSASS